MKLAESPTYGRGPDHTVRSIYSKIEIVQECHSWPLLKCGVVRRMIHCFDEEFNESQLNGTEHTIAKQSLPHNQIHVESPQPTAD